ncbi:MULTISPECIES: hypothetical protein [unclassified Bradyrhizobium]|uniref:hypothetical protein n=1 Tax=unclassified Bradyrhizobium TaxID=2631580 RepID=UPI001FFC141D|nr:MULTISPECIES: hypothetical protein [unclassified Bradyrhizobium]MCK1271370.1 hypothetical protein [Bradyrhizobium sp. 84]MCK1375689.1 hypothetical protein [Bradyrhizobium sp. 49]MCK1427381.1 hypothetical protein [Bradyrhizobium sp. 87]
MEELDRREEQLYRAIGYFIYWFSQLEFTIKARLANALKLDEESMFDIIIGPYDFAMLCTVTKQTLMRTAPEPTKGKIKSFFNACHALNQKARLVVAHGTWTYAGARHVSRSTLAATTHFAKVEDLEAFGQEARRLMMLMYIIEDEEK